MEDEKNPTARWAVVSSFAAVAGAAVCCVGPVVLLSLGASGTAAASLSAFEAYRPLFGIVAAGSLAVAFYRTYGSPLRASGCDDKACEQGSTGWSDRALLWTAALLVGAFFLWPYLPNPGIS